MSEYALIIKMYYDMAINAASCDDHNDDLIAKLSAMNEVYCTNRFQHCSYNYRYKYNWEFEEGTQPHVVKDKGNPPSLRKKKSLIERVCKPMKKKTAQKGNINK